MNSQSDNFERLQKVLALKRYEQPPPGYFENLSARIIQRIEAAEAGHQTWLQRLGFGFAFKPALVCSMGVLACGLLCVGIVSALHGTNANAISAAQQLAFDTQANLPMMAAPEQARSSIDPVVNSAFNQFPLRVERASYTPGQ